MSASVLSQIKCAHCTYFCIQTDAHAVSVTNLSHIDSKQTNRRFFYTNVYPIFLAHN